MGILTILLLFVSQFNTAIQETPFAVFVPSRISPAWLCRTHRYAAQTRTQYEASWLITRAFTSPSRERNVFLPDYHMRTLIRLNPPRCRRASTLSPTGKGSRRWFACVSSSFRSRQIIYFRKIISLSNILTHRERTLRPYPLFRVYAPAAFSTLDIRPGEYRVLVRVYEVDASLTDLIIRKYFIIIHNYEHQERGIETHVDLMQK